jgi:ubiquitin-conjugating enzyme E2 C
MSKSTAGARLQKELMDLMMSGTEGISAFPENDNLFSWLGTIRGAVGTAYEGIDYRVALRFPAQYPFEPPTVHFLTPCYHPNVDITHGAICLDILKENWSAVYTASQVLLSIQSLLDNPNNASPLNPTAAQMWHNKDEYRRAVREAAKVSGASATSAAAPVATATA